MSTNIELNNYVHFHRGEVDEISSNNQVLPPNSGNVKRLIDKEATTSNEVVLTGDQYDGYKPYSANFKNNTNNYELVMSLAKKISDAKKNYGEFAGSNNYQLPTDSSVSDYFMVNSLVAVLIYLWGTILPQQNASVSKQQETLINMMINYSKSTQSLTNVSVELAVNSLEKALDAANIQIIGAALSVFAASSGTVTELYSLSGTHPKAFDVAEKNGENIKKLEENLKPADDALKNITLKSEELVGLSDDIPKYKIDETLGKLDAAAQSDSLLFQGKRIQIIEEHSNQVNTDYNNMKDKNSEFESLIDAGNRLKSDEVKFSNSMGDLIKKQPQQDETNVQILTKMKDGGTIFHKDDKSSYVLICDDQKVDLLAIDLNSKKTRVLSSNKVSEDFVDNYNNLVNNSVFTLKNQENIRNFKSAEVSFYTPQENFSYEMGKFINQRAIKPDSIEGLALEAMQRNGKLKITNTSKDGESNYSYQLVRADAKINKDGKTFSLVRTFIDKEKIVFENINSYEGVPKDLIDSYDALNKSNYENNPASLTNLKATTNDRKALLGSKLDEASEKYAKYKQIKDYCEAFNKYEAGGNILNAGGAFNKHIDAAKKHIVTWSQLYQALANLLSNFSRIIPTISQGMSETSSAQASFETAMSNIMKTNNDTTLNMQQQTLSNLGNNVGQLVSAIVEAYLQALRAAIDGIRV